MIELRAGIKLDLHCHSLEVTFFEENVVVYDWNSNSLKR